MTRAEFYTVLIAAFALLVSIASFILSYLAFWKDNEKLAARSWFYPKHESEERTLGARIKIEAVNKGRRPIILTTLGADYEDGGWRGTYIGKDDKGLQLNEKEKYSADMDDLEHMLFDGENDSAAIDFWFEDTLGKRYRVKGAKRHLELYFKQ